MNRQHSDGFALLITLIVVGVVLSVGLTLLELSIKQVQLSTNSKDSEVAFHAVNAGIECARFWRRAASTSMENGQAINPACFGSAPLSNTHSQVSGGLVSGNGKVFRYQYDFTWGANDERCTKIDTLVATTSLPGAGIVGTTMTRADILTILPGYNKNTDWFCEPGARCTLMSVRGYNRGCSALNAYGTVEREVLLEF